MSASMIADLNDARDQLLDVSRKLIATGLNRGTSGNVSVRVRNEAGQAGFLITPSGMPVEKMVPADMVWMDFSGLATGARQPSSEWRFHLDILQQKPQAHAVIHTHSLFATTLSTLRKDIPAFHYMIAVAGGDTVRCAPYALFGSPELSAFALQALDGRKACLLANHGMIAVGDSLENALGIAIEVETLAEQYLHALQVGNPYILSAQEMREVQEKFKGYSGWTEKS